MQTRPCIFFFVLLLHFLTVPGLVGQLRAQDGVWDEAPGVIEYYNDAGQLVQKNFRYYLTTKHAFFHLEQGSQRIRIQIRHPERIELFGDGNPVRLVLRDGTELEGEVRRSFVYALTGLDEFTFRAPNNQVGQIETFSVPSEAIMSLRFF